MIGSSMGGLISQYGAMRYQNVFSKVGVFSPSFWFHSNIYAQVSDVGRQQPMRFYYYAGGAESASMVTQVSQMNNLMAQNGFSTHELKLTIRSDGQHSESYWAAAFKPAYQWLFRQSAASVEEETTPSVSIYPNPAQAWVRVAWATEDTADFQLIDMQGRTHLRGQMAAGEQIDLTGLAAGLYHLQLHLAGKQHHQKLVIQ
jgi:pimeloyl-ACP methyl ester carboxylesterase